MSQLQEKLEQLLQQAVPDLAAAAEYEWTFTRTRAKNPELPKWEARFWITGRKPLCIRSKEPARELVKGLHRLVVLDRPSAEEYVVGYQPNLEGLLAQLKASPLWVPRVETAVSKTLRELTTEAPATTPVTH